MAWTRETPRRGRVRTHSRGWIESPVAFAIVITLIVAWAGLRLLTPAPVTVDCRVIATCTQTLPVCGPDVPVAADNQSVWYWGRQQPRNASALLGFRPLLPTRINWPTSWDSALLAGPASAPSNVPLLREVYINWQEHVAYPQDLDPRNLPKDLPPSPTPAPAPPSHDAFHVLDETTAAISPLTGVENATSYEFAAQRDVVFGTATGTLYYLAPAGGMPTPAPNPLIPTPAPTVFSTAMGPSAIALLAATRSSFAAGATPTATAAVPDGSYFALVLLWHVGPVTLRMITVLAYYDWSLIVHTSDDRASAAIRIKSPDRPPYLTDFAVTYLLQMAANMQPYTGCGP